MAEKPNTQTLSETENYAVWLSEEPDIEEVVYHLEIGNITIHLFSDEWEEFVGLMMEAMR